MSPSGEVRRRCPWPQLCKAALRSGIAAQRVGALSAQADEEDASGEWIGGEPSCVVPSCEIRGLWGNVEDRGRDSSDKGSLGELSVNRASLGIPSVVI